jgi:hypothetical protein
MVKVRKSLIGDIIGNFLVLSQADDYISPSGTRRAQWNCKCLLCDNNEVVIMDTVLQKETKESCGCLEDLTGRRFGRLTAVEKDGQDKDGNTIWKCACDCGNDISVIHSRLTIGNVQSCGCLRRELASEKFSKENIYNLDGEYGVGWTTNTNKKFYFDLEDYNIIKNYTWIEDMAAGNYHSLRAYEKETGNRIIMSALLGYKNHDHINRNPFDNRKENFRVASAQENARNRSLPKNNTSGFIGVSFDKEYNKWVAYIKLDNKQNKLGRFINKEDAVRARLCAEKKYFGEFSPQRHLFKEYGIEDEFLENPLDK